MNEIPQFIRISDYVDWYAKKQPESVALVLGKRRWTYRQFKKEVDALARALLAAGVRHGDRIATLSTPHPDFFIAFLAASSVGAIWVGLNPRYKLPELCYQVQDSEPRLLLSRSQIDERRYDGELSELRAAAPALEHVVILNEDPVPSGAESLGDFLAAGAVIDDETLAAARADAGNRDCCMIVYTSGSTGQPKGAMLHHEGVVAFSRAQNEIWPVNPLRLVNFLPINHVGCVVDLSTPVLVAGGTLVFMEQFEPRENLALLEREQITFWGSVPSTFQMQLALDDFDKFDLSAVQMIVWEGAAMPVEHIERLARVCPRMATNYGMTETTSGITAVAPGSDLDVLSETVGSPFADLEVRLADDRGHAVPPNEPGEIQVRGSRVMLGYWRRPEATADAIDESGWLRTGDLAVQREDGSFQLIGRLKEMYKSGGYNVYPREIEAVLESHPTVEVAAVVSVPDPVWQEVGIAYIISRQHTSAELLLDYCRERLANYKLPKRIRLVSELPLLPIGKIDKLALRSLAQSEPT